MQLREKIPHWLRAPRSLTLAIAALVLWLLFDALSIQAKFPVAVYKFALLTLAATAGYWIDRIFFPYARPDGYLCRDWRLGTTEPQDAVDFPIVEGYHSDFTHAMLRRAIIVAAVVIGAAVGL